MPFRILFTDSSRSACSAIALMLIVLIFNLLTAEYTHAQLRELEVKLIEEPPTGPVVFLNHPGRVVVIVRSSLTNINFSSNMEILEQRNDPAGGEYMVVLNPENQILTVNAPGFLSEGIPFRGLLPNDRFYYSVEPAPDPESGRISVLFSVQPEQARLYINGELSMANQTLQIEPGPAQVRIELQGYRTIDQGIVINSDNIFFPFQLNRVEQELVRIRTQPPGSEVYVDNLREGISDGQGVLELFRFPGRYELSVSHHGYETQRLQAEIAEGAANEFSFRLERNSATVLLALEPASAEVRVNRQRVDATVPLELSPGSHLIEVARQGYEPHSETITLQRGQRLEHTVTLHAHTGSLLLRVSPSYAQVELRDEGEMITDRWSGSRRMDGLPAGRWELRVSAEGYEPHLKRIQIERDQATEISVNLSHARVQANLSATNEAFTCGDPVTFTYAGSQVTYGTVLSANNRCWLDRNLGASRVATTSTDSHAYGDLFQWGRGADGHQFRDSPTTRILSDGDQPGHGSFVLSSSATKLDWRKSSNTKLWQGAKGVNNPCPSGYRLPTRGDWRAERRSWTTNNATGAFASPLRLPVAGYRGGGSGSLIGVESSGRYWTGSVSGSNSRNLGFNNSATSIRSNFRANGYSVRCIKD